MSVEVTIKNRQLFKKPLTLKDLTLGKYVCGSIDEFGRYTGKINKGDLVFFNKDKRGRGVIVYEWSNDIKNSIDLRLYQMSTRYDIEMFYEIIRNIMHVWKAGSFEQEGCAFRESDIDGLCAEQKENALKFMAGIKDVSGGGSEYITMQCAVFPLDLGLDLLERYGTAQDEEGYADCLHGLQSIEAYYGVPLFFKNKEHEGDYFGNFAVTNDTDTIMPLTPSVPLLFRNPETGNKLECSRYVVSFFSYEKKKVLGQMPFEVFAEAAGLKNCPKYDSTHVLLKGISEERMTGMLDRYNAGS